MQDVGVELGESSSEAVSTQVVTTELTRRQDRQAKHNSVIALVAENYKIPERHLSRSNTDN